MISEYISSPGKAKRHLLHVSPPLTFSNVPKILLFINILKPTFFSYLIFQITKEDRRNKGVHEGDFQWIFSRMAETKLLSTGV